MAKVKYYAKENSTIGTHSFYAVPIPNGTLSFDELLDEAMDGKSVEPSIAKACVTEFMKAVKRNVLKGFRCQLGDNFLTVYPNIQLSVKDTEDPETHAPIVATAEMLNAANSRLLDEDTYKALMRLGILDTSVRSYNRGASDYSRHIIQPWTIWQDYNLNPWDADIVKRILRTKQGDSRRLDYEKIIHICEERIRQIDMED